MRTFVCLLVLKFLLQMRAVAAELPPLQAGGNTTPVNAAEENLRSVRILFLLLLFSTTEKFEQDQLSHQPIASSWVFSLPLITCRRFCVRVFSGLSASCPSPTPFQSSVPFFSTGIGSVLSHMCRFRSKWRVSRAA